VRRPAMRHRSDQRRPPLPCAYFRDVNRGLKTSKDQNHKESLRGFVCHVSTRIFGILWVRKLPGPGCVFVLDQSFGKKSASSARHPTVTSYFECFFC
jgi:hypothetical protein